MITLGGNVCVRNGIELDYNFSETIQSLLPVCDEIVVADGESTDGTREVLDEMAKNEPKIRVVTYRWDNPHNVPDFWINWLNFCREQIKCDWHLQLDADEILFDTCYDWIRDIKKRTQPEDKIAYWAHRWNWFKDPYHLIPHGFCCGFRVCRLAPRSIFMPSDGPHPRAQELIKYAQTSPLEIGHCGFLRKSPAFIKKNKALLGYFFGGKDERIEAAANFDGPWYNMPGICGGWESNLNTYSGTHPPVIHQWLKDRGHLP